MLYSQLQETVAHLKYKPGWSFHLHSGLTFAPSAGTAAVTVPVAPLFLVICARVLHSGTGREITLEHVFAVPPEDYVVPWHWWLLDRVLDVERHEACEFFAIGDERPFYPEHGPGADLYRITERAARGPVSPSATGED